MLRDAKYRSASASAWRSLSARNFCSRMATATAASAGRVDEGGAGPGGRGWKPEPALLLLCRAWREDGPTARETVRAWDRFAVGAKEAREVGAAEADADSAPCCKLEAE